MLKKRIVLISLILLLCGLNTVGVAEYAQLWWRGRKDEPQNWAEDTRWNNPDNWYTQAGPVPTSEDTVDLNGGTLGEPNAVDPIIDSTNVGGNKAECWNLWLPDWQEVNSTPCVLWVTDGVLEVGKDFILGRTSRCGEPNVFPDDGRLEMSGGTITIGQKLSVGGRGNDFGCHSGGIGTINMTGGTITCGTFYIPEGDCVGGTVNLDGGTIYADSLVMNPNDTNGLMYITDGMLILDGNQISLIENYADSNNWISGGEPNWVIQAIYYSNMNTNPEDMDTTRVIARNPELAWSPYPKDDVVRVPYNVILSWSPGTKASDVNGHDVYLGSDEASVRDANVAVPLGVYRGRQSATTYNTAPLALVKGVPYYWRIDEVNNSPTEIFKGVVWSFILDDGRAYDPYPSDTSTVDTIEPTLTWSPGTDSNSHDVYFGTDEAAVENADTNDTAIFVENRDVNNYSPGLLLLGTTYYWRIDEVNTTTIKGHVWSFTTGDYFVVEDFDSYGPDPALRTVWKDWYADPPSKNGANVFVETAADFVSDGQSMKYEYKNFEKDANNNYVGSWAEADTSDLNAGTDWTVSGAKGLVLYFYGDPCNGKDTTGLDQDQMYVALEDVDTNIGIVEYPDMNAVKEAYWHEWNIDLGGSSLSIVDLNTVAKVYIGFGGYDKTGQTTAGAGDEWGIPDTVYFEDITLAASRCVLGYGLQPRVDPSADCYVDLDDLRMLFEPWLFKAYDVNAAEAISHDPCAWYKFDETSGANAYDSSGHGYTATYEHDPCDPCDASSYPIGYYWDPDGGYDSNGCIVFDANFSMSVPANPFWYMDASQITISAWVKDVVMQPETWQTLFHAKKMLSYGDYWMIGQWRPDDFIYSLAADEDAPPGSEDDWLEWEDAEYATDEDWHHYAFVKNVNTGEMIMYLDGVPVATTNATQLMSGVNEFHIGGPAASLEEYDAGYMIGLVDDFRIYGAALSHSEIVKLAGLESVHVGVVPWFLPSEPYVDDKIDLKDYTLIADHWLEVPEWP